MNTIVIDTRQQKFKHEAKHQYFESMGYKVIRSKLPCGDYSFLQDMSVSVDSKASIYEIASNICGKQHERFVRELTLAKDHGIKLYILVENDGEYVDKMKQIYNKPVDCIDDLFSWKNKRAFIYYKGKQKYPNCVKGSTLAKSMMTIEKKYGCTFVFCRTNEAGKRVIELLNGGRKNDGQ